MKDKIIGWFKANWKPIGYTIGIINILSGLSDIMTGSYLMGGFWIGLGSIIIYDVQTSN